MKSNTKWQLSGTSAALYENYLVPTIFVPWAEQLLDRALPQIGESVLDVACGTGIVARMVKGKVGKKGRVVGVDLNGGMLEIARAISSASNNDIEWIEADVGNVPIADNSFDIAFCQHGLQFFPDKVGALKEIRRLLRPDGRFVICVAQELEKNPLMQSQVTALSKHIGEEASGAIRAVCGLSDGEAIKNLFLKAGFQDVEWETVSLTLSHDNGLEFITNGIASTPVAGLIAEWSDEARNALIEDVLKGFGDYYDENALRFPHVSSVVIARNV